MTILQRQKVSDERETMIFPMIDRTSIGEAESLVDMASASPEAESRVLGSSDAGTRGSSHLWISFGVLETRHNGTHNDALQIPAGTRMPPGPPWPRGGAWPTCNSDSELHSSPHASLHPAAIGIGDQTFQQGRASTF